MADPLTKSQDDLSEKPHELVSEIVEQRKSSLRYFNSNYYSEMAEIYRNIHARVKPITYKDEKGEEHEDTSKTNVCVPDHFVMLRRGTARLTRNPPNLHVRGGPDNPEGQANRDKIGAHLMFQWDRSEAQRAFKPTVSHAYGMGWGIGKVYYDEVSVVRRLRRLTKTLSPQDFQNLANSNDPRIAQAMQTMGERLQDETPFSPEETVQMISEFGNEVSLNKKITRYKGPVLANVFPGDLYPEAGFRSLNESAYLTENSLRDEDWLNYWMEQTSIDPRDGTTKPVFDPKSVQKALDKAGSRTYLDEQEMTLRRWMREEIEIADPMTSGKPIKAPKKRVMIDERHSIIDGHLCIDFVAEEAFYLGRLWYPWETYGRYQYCEMVLIPDWLGGIGQSTLKVTRWLLQLRNARLNQTTDFINNKLLPLLLQRMEADYTAYDLIRTGFARIVKVESLADFKFEDTPAFPAEAWEDQAQYKQDLQQVDPTTVDFAPGTAAAPGPGKFATTARLADKAADSVTADTLDQINMFVRDIVELELWMNQQAMDKEESIPLKYMQRVNPEQYALSIRTEGAQAREIKIGPMDIQEDFEVLPEAGSTLASDDDFKVQGLQAFWALGQAHPDIVNLRAVAQALARATPGIDPDTVILPPPPPQPPQPPAKLNISLAIKYDDLPSDVKVAILQREGLPVELTHVEGVGDVIKLASETADHAANLEQPVHQTPEPQPGGNGKQPPAKVKK